MKITTLKLQNGTTYTVEIHMLYDRGTTRHIQIKFTRNITKITPAMIMGATYGDTTFQVSKFINSRDIDCCQVVDVEMVDIGCF